MNNLVKILCVAVLMITGQAVYAQCSGYFETEMDSTGYEFTFQPIFGNYQYSWTFGDGDTSNLAKPTHIYSKSGTYTVCLKVIDLTTSCTNTYCDSVVVGDPCWRRIYSNFEYGRLNLRAQNRNFGATYTWFYGNGDSAKGNAALYDYAKNGMYTVCLRVDDPIRKCSREMCFNLDAQWDYCDPTCEGGLGSDSTHMTMSHVVQSNKNMLRTWKVNGVEIKGETGPQLKYPVLVDSAYVFCLETYDTVERCRDTFCLDAFVPSTTCRADFTYVKDLNTYSFSPLYGRANKVFWDFGNGKTSNLLNPSVQLSGSNSAQVCLTVYCDNGDSVKSCQTIFLNNPCQALYTIALDTNQKFKLYLWNKSSKSNTMSYKWEFGDGSSSTDRNPKHVYSSYGAYNICLTISDNSIQCSDTHCDTVGLDSNGKLLKNGFELVVFDDDLVFHVQEQKETNFLVFPNPATNFLNLKVDEIDLLGVELIEILTLHGQLLKTQNVIREEANQTIDIHDLPEGMYYIRLQSPNVIFKPKLIQVIK
jgi:PKD repeat protein